MLSTLISQTFKVRPSQRLNRANQDVLMATFYQIDR